MPRASRWILQSNQPTKATPQPVELPLAHQAENDLLVADQLFPQRGGGFLGKNPQSVASDHESAASRLYNFDELRGCRYSHTPSAASSGADSSPFLPSSDASGGSQGSFSKDLTRSARSFHLYV
jgi:hypothetical protein